MPTIAIDDLTMRRCETEYRRRIGVTALVVRREEGTEAIPFAV